MDPLPLITAEEPGIGGRIKARDEDFVVREVPLYRPAGRGEHFYLTLRRAGRNTADLAGDLARCFELAPRAIGYAGRKDRHALVTQTFSLHLPGDPRTPAEIARIAGAATGAEVLASDRHENKLRTGHLLANEFEIKVSAIEIDPNVARERCLPIAALLGRRGLPNFFGPQRFGKNGENVARGRQVLKGRARPRRDLADLFVSAYQSQLFNQWLAERIAAGDFERLLPGDIAVRLDSGGPFLVDDPAAEAGRLAAGEISHAGPLFGAKMKAATDAAAERERALLAAVGMKLGDFKRATGARRPGRLPCPDIRIDPEADGLWFRFALPKGAYATTLLREFMKNEPE